jgi:hypothetical protein
MLVFRTATGLEAEARVVKKKAPMRAARTIFFNIKFLLFWIELRENIVFERGEGKKFCKRKILIQRMLSGVEAWAQIAFRSFFSPGIRTEYSQDKKTFRRILFLDEFNIL